MDSYLETDFEEWQREFIGSAPFGNGNTRWQQEAWQAASLAKDAQYKVEIEVKDKRIAELESENYSLSAQMCVEPENLLVEEGIDSVFCGKNRLINQQIERIKELESCVLDLIEGIEGLMSANYSGKHQDLIKSINQRGEK